MPYYTNKIGGLSGEVTDPTEGQKAYNSRGQRVVYDARAGKWVLPQSYVAPGESQPAQVSISGGGDPEGQVEYNLAQLRDMGATARYEDGYYYITDAQGNKYKTTNFWGDTWRAIRAANGEAPTTSNPWYEGSDGPGGIPGPLTATPEYPDGGPIPGGNGYLPFLPADPGGGMGPIGNNPFDPGTGPGTGPNLPGGGTPGGGSMFDGYGPPEGVPLNPIVKQNEMVFSPYGNPAARFSDTLTYGGLPRSTGPWGVMGGYYGGFPENYANPPEGYTPPNPGNWGSSPGNISPGGNIPSNPIPGTTLPLNPWDPATPISFGNQSSPGENDGADTTGGATGGATPGTGTGPGTGPNIGGGRGGQNPYRPHGMTDAEYQALQTYYTVNGLNGTGQTQ